MDTRSRIEAALEKAIGRACAGKAPPAIAEAVRHAVFPGGARVRPRLCLAVAGACGDDMPGLSEAACAAVELLHCASLVHDDMPCFDDAATRRGRPSVHALYGEPLALLAGDALIVLAFETIALEAVESPARMARLITTVANSVGLPMGIVAGQAWEVEPDIDMRTYHRAKTGSLFVGAAMAGAIAAGADPNPWRAFGDRLGEAYQVADDLRDAVGSAADIGKPIGQDAAHHRPNAVGQLGTGAALAHLRGLVEAAIASIPPCPRASELETLILSEAKRLVPKELAQSAA
ncbi:MAG: polyprenyl synthetase family protein [Burkholderiales bacterium]|jgi:geranylgeranyl diphosphate synthase type II|nr:polyprenyl synthetase family protein [Burkholderiales bacterium]